MTKPADWTSGTPVIRYQRCDLCQAVQYFHRDFCATCGGTELAEEKSSGEGTVYAASLVCRAATPATRANVPYNVVLVDIREGFRMMAHGDGNLAIGDAVIARFVPFAGRLVPHFEKIKS